MTHPVSGNIFEDLGPLAGRPFLIGTLVEAQATLQINWLSFGKYFRRKFCESSQLTTVSPYRIPEVPHIPVVSDIETLHEANVNNDNNQSSGPVHDAMLLSGDVTICQVKLGVLLSVFV